MSGLDTIFFERFEVAWIQAWNDHDVETIRTMCSPEVVMVDPGSPEAAHGWPTAGEGVVALFTTFPDFHIDMTRWYLAPTDPEAMLQWRFSATMTGPVNPPGFAPTNASVCLDGATRLCFRGDLVSEVHWYYDVMELGRQIGAAPEPGSMAERSAVWMQHLKARKSRKARKLGKLTPV